MKARLIFAEGLGTGIGVTLLTLCVLLLAARGSRLRSRIRQSIDRGALGDPAPPANYLDLCRAAGL